MCASVSDLVKLAFKDPSQELIRNGFGPWHLLIKCDLEGALEAQGDCKGGIKTILTKLEVYYSPAEEELRLGVFFHPLQGNINLTKL